MKKVDWMTGKSALHEGRILVVAPASTEEDAPAALLLRRGYDIVEAVSRDEALAAFETQSLDLVLLDLIIEQKDPSLLESIREQACPLSVLAMTNCCSHAERLDALQRGAEDILSTPLDADELAAKVSVHLNVARLRKELDARNAELETKNIDLAHLIDLKDRFLALATHDIRTPITTMKLATDVLEHQLPETAQTLVRKPLDILMRNMARIEAKIDEYFLIAKLDLRRIHLDIGPLELNSVVQDAIASFFPGAISRGIDLDASFGEIPLMRGDARKIGQLACELIETSLERLETKNRVIVKTRLDDDGVWIRVTDDGRPFEEGGAAALINGLQQESPTNQTRVPLYAAYKIATAHGGRLTIDSSHEAGTLFAAWLPLDAKRKPEDRL